METSDTFFYFDGEKVVGPHSKREIQEMYANKILKDDSQVCTANDHGWKALKEFQNLLKNDVKKPIERVITSDTSEPSDVVAPSAAPTSEGVEATQDDEDEDFEGKFTPIRQIRAILNDLWEAQRESIIANIRNEKLDDEFEKKRKQHIEIKDQIRELALAYWRKSKVLNEWIKELTKENSEGRWDYRKKLSRGKPDENFEKVIKWLDDDNLADSPGCYAFRSGQDYIYIGMTEGSIKQRLKEHRDKIFWNDSTHIRIVIPRRKDKALALERLLILKYQPERNRNEGNSLEGSQADDCLNFIIREIDQLLTDA